MPIFGIRANLSFSLVLIGLSSGGTEYFTTVYMKKGNAQRGQRKAYCWETRWTEVPNWGKVSICGQP